MTNKIYLCSFASSDLDRSVKRFKKQANELNVYEKINIYRPKNLSNELKEKVNASKLTISPSSDKNFKHSSKETIKEKEFEINFN